MRNAVTTDKAPKPMGPYSQAILDGDLVYLAGMGPVCPGTGKPELGDIRAQTTLTFRNVKAILEAAGSSLDKVIRCTVYLQDIGDFAAMNEVYARTFALPYRPTIRRTLPASIAIEIECTARC
jgi:2-iminobutanoate/2-iminopropanoate deaminase